MSDPCFILDLVPVAGTTFEDAAQEALRLSERLGVVVTYVFNLIIVRVYPSADLMELCEAADEVRRGERDRIVGQGFLVKYALPVRPTAKGGDAP